jgi:RND family efflux transporter MFP subunit
MNPVLLRRAAMLALAVSLVACSGRGGADAPAAASAPAARGASLARGRVEVPGGLVRLSALRPGRIERWAVDVGDAVKAGQLLVTLDGRDAQAEVALVQAEVAQAQAQIDAQAAKLPSARERAARLLKAAQAGAGAGQAADDARDAVQELEQQLKVMKAGLVLAQRRLAQAELAAQAASVRAPAAGRVVQRLAHEGELVEAHAPLLQLLPDGPRMVRAELNETLLPRVKPGMRAQVLPASEEGPAQGAKVVRIGEVFAPARNADSPAQDVTDARTVECWLQLDNPAFLVGQRVLVRFDNERTK